MRAVGIRAGAAQNQTPLPKRLRAGSFAALMSRAGSSLPLGASALLLLIVITFALPRAAQAQNARWDFQDDALADLWFHGLAVVGLHGFGHTPLYDPGYALRAREERSRAGVGATTLERQRASFLGAFQGDEAFEVLHFVPLYFGGASRIAAMAALKDVAAQPQGTPRAESATRLGTQVVAGLLVEPGQRRLLGAFLEALEEEWTQVVQPARQRRAASGSVTAAALMAAWDRDWARPLAGFLSAEGVTGGTVLMVPALGAEGRFLERGPQSAQPLVAVGIPHQGGTGAALSSLLRELCFPAVRRAFAPFEGRFSDRRDASRASDLAATRCGELLLERSAPEQVAAYRARFGISPSGMGPGFLSASGNLPGVAAWEGQLETALLRELNLDSDDVRAPAPLVGRIP